MRQRSINYFFGSLFSRQSIVAYGIAGSFTTLFQLLLLWRGYFSGFTTQTDSLPAFLELYIETLIPLWIPPITRWNALMLLFNVIIALLLLWNWTIKYDRSF